MKNILVFGAGKSATYLIDYLSQQSIENNWLIKVCDASLELAQAKVTNHTNAFAVSIDVENDADRNNLIAQSDIVISLLPPHLHLLVARSCLLHKKDLLR